MNELYYSLYHTLYCPLFYLLYYGPAQLSWNSWASARPLTPPPPANWLLLLTGLIANSSISPYCYSTVAIAWRWGSMVQSLCCRVQRVSSDSERRYNSWPWTILSLTGMGFRWIGELSYRLKGISQRIIAGEFIGSWFCNEWVSVWGNCSKLWKHTKIAGEAGEIWVDLQVRLL